MTGPSSTLRATFLANGTLPNTQDTNFRSVSASSPTFGFATDLGTVSSAAETYVIGNYRDPVVNWTAVPATAAQRSSYFMASYPSLSSSLNFFYDDLATAASASAAFDAQLQADATKSINAQYAALCALAARQVWGGMEITIGRTASGAYDTDDVMLFV